MAFFETISDSDLENSMILKDVSMFIQKFEYVGTGVASTGVPTANDVTLTPAVSPAWTIDEFNSTVADNIVVVADSSKVLEGAIDDTTATTVVFDTTNTVDVSDGTAGAIGDFTDTNTYNFYALTASANNTYGDYFGFVNEITIAQEEETAEYKLGVPRKLKNEGLLEKTISVTGSHANLSNSDVVKALFNVAEYGNQTGQTELHAGFDPAVRSFYRLTLVGENSNGQAMVYQFFKGKLRTEGGVPFGEEGWKVSSFNYMVHSDTLRPKQYDAFRYILTD
jgi:hypothetical protein